MFACNQCTAKFRLSLVYAGVGHCNIVHWAQVGADSINLVTIQDLHPMDTFQDTDAAEKCFVSLQFDAG